MVEEADSIVVGIHSKMVCTMVEIMVLCVLVVVILEVQDGQDDLMMLKDGRGIQGGNVVLEVVLVYQVC